MKQSKISKIVYIRCMVKCQCGHSQIVLLKEGEKRYTCFNCIRSYCIYDSDNVIDNFKNWLKEDTNNETRS